MGVLDEPAGDGSPVPVPAGGLSSGTRQCRLVVAAGDGIGPSVVTQALKVLDVLVGARTLDIATEVAPIGGQALTLAGHPLPPETLLACRGASGVLLGAVGDPEWDRRVPAGQRPTAALLRLRRELGAHTNVRPVHVDGELCAISPLRRSAQGDAISLVIVRETTGGLMYGGERGRRVGEGNDMEAFDTMALKRSCIRRTGLVAWELAEQRRHHVTSVDQANVLESGRLWREVMEELAEEKIGGRFDNMLVDNCASTLVKKPETFDVIVTEGIFGGILSDEAGALAGSIGLMGSMTLGAGTGIYEPVHGSAPRHAGKDRANPIGAIRSLALYIEVALKRPDLAKMIESAIAETIGRGVGTYDIMTNGRRLVGTEEMGDLIASRVSSKLSSCTSSTAKGPDAGR